MNPHRLQTRSRIGEEMIWEGKNARVKYLDFWQYNAYISKLSLLRGLGSNNTPEAIGMPSLDLGI